MGIDELLLFGFYFIFFVCLILAFSFNKKVAIINFITLVTYNTYSFLYISFSDFEGKGGTPFIFIFFILFFNCIHFVGLFTYLILKRSQLRQKSIHKIKYFLLIILSFTIVVVGVLFRVSHWPWSNAILITGIVLLCVAIIHPIFNISKKNLDERK